MGILTVWGLEKYRSSPREAEVLLPQKDLRRFSEAGLLRVPVIEKYSPKEVEIRQDKNTGIISHFFSVLIPCPQEKLPWRSSLRLWTSKLLNFASSKVKKEGNLEQAVKVG